MRIDYGKTTLPLDVAKIEEMYEAKYICDMSIQNKIGGWTERPAQIYWQKNPPMGHQQHFAIFITGDGRPAITSAACLKGIDIDGVLIDDEVVIFSRYRHDYREYKNIGIDGGRDYTRLMGMYERAKRVVLQFEDDKLVVVKNS